MNLEEMQRSITKNRAITSFIPVFIGAGHEPENCPCDPALLCDPNPEEFGYFEYIHKPIRH